MSLKKDVETLKKVIWKDCDDEEFDQGGAVEEFDKGLRKAKIDCYDLQDIDLNHLGECGKIEFYQDDDYFYTRNIK